MYVLLADSPPTKLGFIWAAFVSLARKRASCLLTLFCCWLATASLHRLQHLQRPISILSTGGLFEYATTSIIMHLLLLWFRAWSLAPQLNSISWKRMGPYSVKCRRVAQLPRLARRGGSSSGGGGGGGAGGAAAVSIDEDVAERLDLSEVRRVVDYKRFFLQAMLRFRYHVVSARRGGPSLQAASRCALNFRVTQ